MNSLILRTATRFLVPLLLLFSIFLLLRGHNEPGGGFVGGLMAASAFILYAIAFDVKSTLRELRFDPHLFIGFGLLIALISGLFPLLVGRPFLTGLWGYVGLPGVAFLELGTTLFFDIGVYLPVLGVTLMIILTLAEE
jgi:multicomponent Na+:H+ antiporter subunit B